MVTVFGFFLLLLFPEHVHLLVLVDPSPISNVTYGKPFFFNCTFPSNWESAILHIPGENGFKFAIFNGGHCGVPFDRRKNYSIGCHGDTLTYGILKPVDGTTWSCKYKYSTTQTEEEEHGETTLILQPDEPVITLQKTNYIIKEGANLSIPCTFTGAPISNVSWKHGNSVMKWSNQNKPLFLSFQNVSRTYASNYTCIVTVNFKGIYTTLATVSLIVEYPPTLRSSNDTTVDEGTDAVTLFCDIVVDGFPRNYSNLHWQHWRENQLIRELDSDDSQVNSNDNRFSLTLTSVNYNDTGCYTCSMGNGVQNLEGKINQTAQLEVLIKAIPRILDPKPEYHGQVGRRFKIEFELVGHPAPQSSIIVLEGPEVFKINKTETNGPIRVDIYDKIVIIDGIILEMDFGKIENRFRTTYQLIAKNAMGNVTQSFVVKGHDFPSKPFHIHFNAFEGFALLEWEAKYPDLDMKYEVILKNDTGIQVISRVPGQNAKIYEYRLTNLSMSKVYILQLCTTNVLGKNCSSTFKIKMDSLLSRALQANQKPMSDKTFVALTVIGGIGLLFILMLVLIVVNHRRRRKRKNTPFLERRIALGRNRHSMQGLTSELETSENTCNLRDARLSVNTYLTPQCMNSLNSPLLGSTSCQINLEGSEYASVDDPDIIKLSTRRNQSNGICHTNGCVPMNENCSPHPRRSNEYLAMDEQTKGCLKSSSSKSTQLKKSGKADSAKCQSTEYVSMDEKDDKLKTKAECQNGGYQEIEYPKKYVRK